MAMGKQVGRLSIRVLPDATRFREDLKLMIKRAESSMAMNLTIRANTKEAELALARFRKTEAVRGLNLRVGVASVTAKAQLALLARDRIVKLEVQVGKASMAKASAILAGISGVRIAKSILTDVNNALGKIDLNLPKITRMATGIALLTSTVLSSSAGLITLAGDLSKVGNTAFLLPAILGGLTTGIVVLALALKDSKAQLASLGPSMIALQDSVSAEFWARAKQPIIDFVQSVLPALRDGFARTAAALGNQAAAIAAAFQTTLGGGVLTAMFDRLVETMDIVTGGAQDFAEALTTIGTVGSNYLPRLATWVVALTDQFNTWTQRVAASGELDAFIESGITSFKLLGASIADIARIFRGIDAAATAAGGGGLAKFAESMKGAAEIVNGAVFQKALTTILEGASAGLSAVGGGIKAFGTTIAELAPQISEVLTLAGGAVGGLVTAISGALAQPAFKEGLVAFFEGLKTGVDALGPAMVPLFAFVGQLGTSVGVLAANFGPLLASIKETFAPLLESVLQAATPLIPLLAGGLTSAISGLSPVIVELSSFVADNAAGLQTLALMIAGVVVAIKAVQFGGLIVDLTRMTAAWVANTAAMVVNKAETIALMAMYAKDMVVALAKSAAGLAVSTAAWIANTAAQIAAKVATIAGSVATGIATGVQAAFNLVLSLNPIGLIIIAIAALVAALVYFFTQTELGQDIVANVGKFFADVFANIQKVIAAVVDWIVANWPLLLGILLGPIGLLIAFVITHFEEVSAFFQAVWATIVGVFTAVWEQIVAVVTNAINGVLAVINFVGSAIAFAWNLYWDIVFGVINFIWNGIVALVQGAVNLVQGIIQAAGAAISAVWSGIWNGVIGVANAAWTGVTGIVTGIVDGVLGMITSIGDTLASIPGIVGDAFASAGTWLLDAGKSIIQGLIDGVLSMVDAAASAAEDVMDAIADFFPHSPAKKGPFSGRGWTLHSGKAMGAGLADGIDSSISKVRNSALAMMSAASGASRVDVDAAASAGEALTARGDGTTIRVDGNVGYNPQEIADEIDKKKRQAAMLAGLRTVAVA